MCVHNCFLQVYRHGFTKNWEAEVDSNFKHRYIFPLFVESQDFKSEVCSYYLCSFSVCLKIFPIYWGEVLEKLEKQGNVKINKGLALLANYFPSF